MKKFKIKFIGRARNSHGSFAILEQIIFAQTEETAILKLGEDWESNAILLVENVWVS